MSIRVEAVDGRISVPVETGLMNVNVRDVLFAVHGAGLVADEVDGSSPLVVDEADPEVAPKVNFGGSTPLKLKIFPWLELVAAGALPRGCKNEV